MIWAGVLSTWTRNMTAKSVLHRLMLLLAGHVEAAS